MHMHMQVRCAVDVAENICVRNTARKPRGKFRGFENRITKRILLPSRVLQVVRAQHTYIPFLPEDANQILICRFYNLIIITTFSEYARATGSNRPWLCK